VSESAAPHRRIPMTGRDPGERHRGASPLELLFDLTFVVAFSAAASEFAHLLADDHIGAALIGFTIAMFAVCWAWINSLGSRPRSTPTTGCTAR